MNFEFSFGKQAEEDIAKNNAENLARVEAKAEKALVENKEKFDSIQIGARIGYKSTPENPVQFFIVESKNEENLTVDLKSENSTGNEAMSTDPFNVVMDQIIDIQN